MFAEGQKVVCIDDSIPSSRVMGDFKYWITAGQSYTIRECKYSQLTGRYGVKLKEVKNPPIFFPELLGKTEPAYDSSRFRAIEDTKALNAILKQLEEYGEDEF